MLCHVCWPCHGVGIGSWSSNIYTPILLVFGQRTVQAHFCSLAFISAGLQFISPHKYLYLSIPCRIPKAGRDFTGLFVLFIVQQLCHGCCDREFPGGRQGQGGTFPSGCAHGPGRSCPSLAFPEWVWSKAQSGIPSWMLRVQGICSSASPEHSEIRSCFQNIMDL